MTQLAGPVFGKVTGTLVDAFVQCARALAAAARPVGANLPPTAG